MPMLLRLSLGFLVGVVSVLIFHQGTVFLIGALGLAPTRVYQWTPNPWGVPMLINQCFWGGLWGALFITLWDRLPRRIPGWLFGLIFGVLGPAMVNWTVLPLIRGQVLFGGFDPTRMLITALIGGMFGIGLALLLPVMSKLLKPLTGGR